MYWVSIKKNQLNIYIYIYIYIYAKCFFIRVLEYKKKIIKESTNKKKEIKNNVNISTFEKQTLKIMSLKVKHWKPIKAGYY